MFSCTIGDVPSKEVATPTPHQLCAMCATPCHQGHGQQSTLCLPCNFHVIYATSWDYHIVSSHVFHVLNLHLPFIYFSICASNPSLHVSFWSSNNHKPKLLIVILFYNAAKPRSMTTTSSVRCHASRITYLSSSLSLCFLLFTWAFRTMMMMSQNSSSSWFCFPTL
jgi:hypothetical protein